MSNPLFENLPVVNNESNHHFEMAVEGQIAFIDYRIKDSVIYLVHTEVPAILEGRGVGGTLVEKVLQYLENHQLKMVPLCVFVQAYLKRHPEWNRLVAN